MKGGFPINPTDRLPRWIYLILVALIALLFFAISQAVTSGQERKKTVVTIAEKALKWGQGLEKRVEKLEAQVKALEERPTTVNKHVLNIKTVETVCHHGKRVWAVRFDKPDGTEGWFIAPKTEAWGVVHGDVRLQECDGSEEVHPSDRDKILEELKQ